MTTVYQIKITIEKEKVWRRALVLDSFTFWELHIVMIDMMEWGGKLYYYFKIDSDTGTEYIESFPNKNDTTSKLTWKTPLKPYISNPKCKISYVYHGYDEYICEVTVEKILKFSPRKEYPAYIAGNKLMPEDLEYPSGLAFTLPEIFDVKRLVFVGTERELSVHKGRLLDFYLNPISDGKFY
jgi:hypothetical protein